MIRTAECVSPKHPDKLCDQISDAILDACLAEDPMSRVAMETMGGHGIVTITGELTTKAYVDIPRIAKSIVGDKIGVQVNVVSQSPEISRGVDTGGAGDQGIMVGYACKGNREYVPDELYLARSLCRHIYSKAPADGKTQVTMQDGIIKTVVASWCGIGHGLVLELVTEWLGLIDRKYVEDDGADVLANPAGDWDIGGFEADTGLTGRKLAVDNYGPRIPLGGGAFSGKDPTKVDRSAAYKARQLAVRHMLDKGTEDAYCYLAYAIGEKYPVQATILSGGLQHDIIERREELTPEAIIRDLDLRAPIYRRTAEWGHMGNGFKWDR